MRMFTFVGREGEGGVQAAKAWAVPDHQHRPGRAEISRRQHQDVAGAVRVRHHDRNGPGRRQAQFLFSSSRRMHFLHSSSRRTPLSYAHIFRHLIHAKTHRKTIALTIFRHPDGSRDPDFQHVHWLQVWVPASAWMTEKNEFSALIIAKMCESDSGLRRDDGV